MPDARNPTYDELRMLYLRARDESLQIRQTIARCYQDLNAATHSLYANLAVHDRLMREFLRLRAEREGLGEEARGVLPEPLQDNNLPPHVNDILPAAHDQAPPPPYEAIAPDNMPPHAAPRARLPPAPGPNPILRARGYRPGGLPPLPVPRAPEVGADQAQAAAAPPADELHAELVAVNARRRRMRAPQVPVRNQAGPLVAFPNAALAQDQADNQEQAQAGPLEPLPPPPQQQLILPPAGNPGQPPAAGRGRRALRGRGRGVGRGDALVVVAKPRWR